MLMFHVSRQSVHKAYCTCQHVACCYLGWVHVQITAVLQTPSTHETVTLSTPLQPKVMYALQLACLML